MNNVDVSIIIVNYRTWEYLYNCIRSFNIYPPNVSYEILIVDNGPEGDDNFSTFKNAHPEITFIKNTGNHGFSNGCNLGAHYSSGNYLLFLNPDTELTRDNAIDAMFEFVQKNKNIGIVSCRNITSFGVGEETRYLSPWFLFGFARALYRFVNKKQFYDQYDDRKEIWYPDWVTGSVVLISKKLFGAVGGWNQERYWMYFEDPDLCFKVSRLGKKVALLRNVAIKHIEGGASEHSIDSDIRIKSETIISAHNYIQENTNGIESNILHVLHFLKVQSLILTIILSLPFYSKKETKIKSKIGVLKKTWKYYSHVICNKSWINPRLVNIKK